MFTQTEYKPLRITKLDFFNELPKGGNELMIELATNVMMPGDLAEKQFLLKYDLKIHDNNEKFKLYFTAKTQVTYTDDFENLDALRSAIDDFVPTITPEVQKLLKKITEDFGINPIDVSFE